MGSVQERLLKDWAIERLFARSHQIFKGDWSDLAYRNSCHMCISEEIFIK